jgi:putative flippase GtrA
VNLSRAALLERARSPGGRKLVRYTMVSVIVVPFSQAVFLVCYGVLEWRTARSANFMGFALGTTLSYYLNRYWAWGKRGRSHFMKEVAPFWAMAFIGLAVSTLAVELAEDWAHEVTDRRMVQTLLIMGVSLSAWGVLWIVKFFVLNKLLFRTHPEDLEDAPALDGRSGLPT